jgi:hypothetical protein
VQLGEAVFACVIGILDVEGKEMISPYRTYGETKANDRGRRREIEESRSIYR